MVQFGLQSYLFCLAFREPTLLEKLWRISLYVTDDPIAKL